MTDINRYWLHMLYFVQGLTYASISKTFGWVQAHRSYAQFYKFQAKKKTKYRIGQKKP